MEHVHIHVTGIVQGVGIRPFVYREAAAHGVAGWVLNAGDGVHIEAHASATALAAFARDLREHAPAASRVENVDVDPLAPDSWDTANEQGFRIVASEDETAHTTLVSPDIATCNDCLRELFDPTDRRYHYPFINCTNCGPRFTIIRSLPYDRAATSMSAFPMCPACAEEYADPLDRRFHAQPDACFECGPHITWQERDDAKAAAGRDLASSDAIIERCIDLLAAGGIVAIKGLGGFHLACDAGNEAAVTELRRRKRRSNKPLAVMVRNIQTAEELCHIDETERALLTGSVRPIVLLRRRGNADDLSNEAGIALLPGLAPSVAFDLPELGVMLPYTPLQHLLLAAAETAGMTALVMTSGNLSEEPIETDDALAWTHLVSAGIADALLGNDRAILSRYDDSVMRVVSGTVMPVRRARGYAPQPLALPRIGSAHDVPAVLACGSEQKATIAFTRENADGTASCFLSQHIGDVENGATFDAWNDARNRFEALFDLKAEALACDLHPSYLPSQWAREQARATGFPLVEVQHHHAHIASVMAEAAVAGKIEPDARVLGIAFDGTGAGTDGTVWGGEFLLASLDRFERAAHLRTWALPGGAASVRDARRNAFSLLTELGLLEHPGAAPLLSSLDGQTRSVTATMIERSINTPRTSSVGRLFDAAAALLGICGQATYEGEPAIQLEAAAWRAINTDAEEFFESEGEILGKNARFQMNEVGFDSQALSPVNPHGVEPPDSQTSAGPNSPNSFRLNLTGSNSASPDSIGTASGASCNLESGIFAYQTNPDCKKVDSRPLIEQLLDGIARGDASEELALAFHRDVAALSVCTVAQICAREGLATVALSGGVFMNRMLLQLVVHGLESAGLTVLTPTNVPVNDGCIAYGQAAIARARLAAGL